MTNIRLDDLTVPAPPYRMTRPLATLAADPPPSSEPLTANIKQRLARQRQEALRSIPEAGVVEKTSENPSENPLEALLDEHETSLNAAMQTLDSGRSLIVQHEQGPAAIAKAETVINEGRGLRRRASVSASTSPSTPGATPATETGSGQQPLTAFMSETVRAKYEKDKAAGRDVSGIEGQAALMRDYRKAQKAVPTQQSVTPEPLNTAPVGPADALPQPTAESKPTAQPPAPKPMPTPAVPAAPKPKQETQGPKVPTKEDIAKLLTERDSFQEGSPDWRRLQRMASDAEAAAGITGAPPELSKVERSKLDETRQLRELSDLQSAQRDLEKQIATAQQSGDAKKAEVLRDGVIELETQIAGKRAEIQGDRTDEEMSQLEMEHARKSAVVEDFTRTRAQEEQRKADEASDRRVMEMAQKVALETTVKEIANRYRDRGALSAAEWERYKHLALEEATVEQENKARAANARMRGHTTQYVMMEANRAGELAVLRQRLEQAQVARGEQMYNEEEAHGEALQEQAERSIPRPDRMNMGGYLAEAFRYVTERTGNPSTWWETFARRMDIVENRHLALFNGMFQQRVQNKLDNATAMVRDYEDKLRDAGILSKLWYGNRLRVWQKRANNLEAKVDAWNARRERFTARHTALQQEVINRYQRELAPYQEQVRDLSGRLEVQMRAMETLSRHRDEALERLTQAEAAGKRGRWFMGPRARRCVNQIKEQIKDMDRRIAAAELSAARYRKQVADAQGQVDNWELKIRTTSQQILLPEQRDLRRPTRGPAVPVRQVNEVQTTVPRRAPRQGGAPGTTPERDPSQLEWGTDDFVRQWNENGLTNIEDARAFTEYVELSRRGVGLTGNPTAEQLIGLLRPYVQRSAVKPDMRQFERDVRFFLTNVRPTP